MFIYLRGVFPSLLERPEKLQLNFSGDLMLHEDVDLAIVVQC